MGKETFYIGIDKEQMLCLKKIALEKGIGADDLIEKLLDNYIEEKSIKDLQRKKFTLMTQVPQIIIEAIEEKGVYLNEHKILQSIENRYTFTEECRNREGVIYEVIAEVTLLEIKTGQLYLLRYNWIITDRAFQGEDIVEVLIDKVQDKEGRIRGIKYVWQDKVEYQDYEREIFVHGLGIRFMPSEKSFNNYVKDTMILINNEAIQDFIKENN